ncbi:ROBO4 protein, partial [Ptilonorhynchus violaceus]|nr:ROBO4 protein [Ptilonorhynchus violaceus]
LRENFRLQPGDLVTTAGQVLELDCVPPSGHPEPYITWKKDGMILDLVGGRYAVTNGKLQVASAQRSDSGLYICVAANAAGTRESRGARVSVLDRLVTGQREAAPRDLLAVRLHLDNGTALPTAAVQLRWRMLMPVPVPVGYMVLYRSLLPITTSWVQHDAGRELSTIIPALQRGYKYEFKVRPYTGGTQGSDSNIRHLWIPEEAVPSAAPQRVTVGQAETGNGTVVVSWEPPPPEAHNGIIQGYQVWSTGEGWQRPTNRTVDGATRRLETLLPHPGTEFCVQVAAFNSAGMGVPSNATCGVPGRGWRASIGDTDGTLAGRTERSSRVVQALQQPAVIAAAGSMLWLALLALLLLVCQRRASQDAAARHRLVAGDSPWLGGPWKPSCAPRNLSSSSSLSSRLLGSDGRDPHPSSESRGGWHPHPVPWDLQPSSEPQGWDPHLVPILCHGTPTKGVLGPLPVQWDPPSIPHDTIGSPPSSMEPLTCCHRTPNRTLTDTPNPAPWERVCKRGGYEGHMRGHGGHQADGPRLCVPRSPRRAASSAQHPGAHSGPQPHPSRQPQQRGHEGDTAAAVMDSRDRRLPVFSSPKPHRGGTALSSGVARSPVTPPRPPRAWHPPVTRHPRDTFLATRYPQDTSPATRHPRDRSPATERLSLAFSDAVLTQQQVAEDLEMDQDTTCSRIPQCQQCPHCVPHRPPAPATPRSFSPLHTYGYIYGPPASELGEEEEGEEEEEEEEDEEEEERTATRGSPGGSLLNGWGSVSEDNFASARCSLVSSCDGSFLLDASFARALAVAVDGLCYSLEDTD